MHSIKRHAGQISGQFLIFLAIAAFLALGLIGLILPIIPGLLFLAIAAILLAPYIPVLGDWMRRSPLMARYMDDAERLHTLEFPDQVKLGFFLSLRMLIDSVKFVFSLLRDRLDSYSSDSARSRGARF